MSLRGLDSYITGHWGDDYWGNKYDEYYGTFICGFCIASDHKHCVSKHCGCPYRSPGDRSRMGREHQGKRGKLALVMDKAKAPQRYAWDEPGWADENRPVRTNQESGEASSGNVAGASGLDAVSSDDAYGQALASPDDDEADVGW